MRTRTLALTLPTLFACGSSNSMSTTSALSITDLMIPSTVKAGSATMGSVEVSDSSGLGGTLGLSFDVKSVSGSLATSFSSSVAGSASATQAPIDFEFELGATTPPGDYDVTVTVTEGSATSNPLSTKVEVQ
jgi:hypothetical protein